MVSPDGNLIQYLSFAKGSNMHSEPTGFSGWVGSFSGIFSIEHIDPDKSTRFNYYKLADDAKYGATVIADPRAGTLVLGKFGRNGQNDPPSFRAAFLNAVPVEVWSAPLANTVGVIFGAGMDLASNALVITDGSAKFGGGSISAQWFSSSGKDLTGEFQLLSGEGGQGQFLHDRKPLCGSPALVDRAVSGPISHYCGCRAERLVLAVASGPS